MTNAVINIAKQQYLPCTILHIPTPYVAAQARVSNTLKYVQNRPRRTSHTSIFFISTISSLDVPDHVLFTLLSAVIVVCSTVTCMFGACPLGKPAALDELVGPVSRVAQLVLVAEGLAWVVVVTAELVRSTDL